MDPAASLPPWLIQAGPRGTFTPVRLASVSVRSPGPFTDMTQQPASQQSQELKGRGPLYPWLSLREPQAHEGLGPGIYPAWRSANTSAPHPHTTLPRAHVTDRADKLREAKSFAHSCPINGGFLGGSDGKQSACYAGDLGSIPGLGRSPGEGKGLPTPVFLSGEFHGQRSLAGYSPRGCKELGRD